MKIIAQLAFLFTLCFACEAVSRALPFAFPGSVIAMLVLLALFALRAVKPQSLEPVAGFLLGNMPLLFVAPMVMILDFLGILRGRIAAVVFVCAVSTLVTMAATALAVSLVLRLKNAEAHDE